MLRCPTASHDLSVPRRLLMSLGVLLVLGCLSNEADACSCAVLPDRVAPKTGDVVPANAKFWLPAPTAAWIAGNHLIASQPERGANLRFGFGKLTPTSEELTHSLVLTNSNGNGVAFDVLLLRSRPSGRVRYFILSPHQDLPTGTVALRPAISGSDDSNVIVVTATSSRLEQPPRLPTLGQPEAIFDNLGSSEMCLRGDHFLIPFAHDGVAVTLALTHGPTMLPERPLLVSDVFADDDIVVGSSGCSRNWDFERGPITVRAGSYDIAGNFSGWTQSLRLEHPTPGPSKLFPAPTTRGCACSLSPEPPPTSLAMHALAMFLLFRRRAGSSETREGH